MDSIYEQLSTAQQHNSELKAFKEEADGKDVIWSQTLERIETRDTRKITKLSRNEIKELCANKLLLDSIEQNINDKISEEQSTLEYLVGP